MPTRLKFDITENELAVIKLMQVLGNPYEFRDGMKVRAMYTNVRIWLYGKVVNTGFNGKFISVQVERSKHYMRKAFKDCPLCFMVEGNLGWIEPYDY